MTTSSVRSYRIRPASSPSDAELLHDFVCEFAACSGKRDCVKLSPSDYIRDSLSNPHPKFHSAFAETFADDKWIPVGFVIWFMSYSTWKGSKIYMEDLYVREQYRRNGVGKKLLGYCVERGRELGCTGVEWVVNKWNDVGKKMYEGVGATYLDDGVWELMTLNKEGMENILRGQAANGI